MKILTLVLVLSLALSLPGVHVAPVRAQVAGAPAPWEAVTPDPASGGSLVGGLSAVACGLFGRALTAGLVFPGVIAGAIASCGLMLFIALTLDEPK
jgi:hypothetical protein